MALGPINYSQNMAQLDVSPLFALARQLEANRANRAEEAQRDIQIGIAQAEQDRKVAADAAWQTDVKTAFENPTTENFQRLYQHSGKLDAAKALYSNYTDEQKTRNLNAAMEVGGLLNAGNNELALKKLKDRRTALANGGESTEITDSMIADLESGDAARVNHAKAKAGTVIAMSIDPEKAGPLLDRLGYGATYQLEREKFDETKRHNRATEGVADARLGISQAASARADRKAAGGGKGGGGKGRKGAYSDAQLDALIK